MIEALIIDDEEPSRLHIRNLLSSHTNEIQIIGEAKSGEEAIELINKKHPHLIFLDIHLLDMTGFDVLNSIQVPSPFIIFTTAYEEFALRAYEELSIEYLVKPISQERFDSAIEKLLLIIPNAYSQQYNLAQLKDIYTETKNTSEVYSLAIKQTNEIILLDFNNILYLKAEDKYVRVIDVNGKSYLYDKSLQHLEELLPNHFLRIHRSFIINMKSIKRIVKDFKSRYVFTLKDPQESRIASSQSYKEQIKMKFRL